MKMPPMSATSDTLVDHSIYLEANLEADERTRDLAVILRELLQQLDDSIAAFKTVRIQRIKKLAKRNFLDDQIDMLLGTISHGELMRFFNDKKAQRYQYLFPHGTSGISRLPSDEKIQELDLFRNRFAEEANDPIVIQYMTQLTTVIDQFRTSVSELTQAENAIEQVRNRQKDIHNSWRNSYSQIYGELITLFPNRKNKVESFFYRVKNNKKPKE